MAHKPELQALAIREEKIYLQELPKLVRQPVELFLDIEGVPDRQFYYLIGLLVSENETTTYHPFWADTTTDEVHMWQQFLVKVSQYPNAPIYHYGSFEPRSLTTLAKRYDTHTDILINRLININKYIFGKVYFPVYSNRLKEIGNFIGATWTSPEASGLQSLVWRHYWDETRNINYRNLLLTYNQDDCLGLKVIVDELLRIKLSANTLSEVDFVDKRKDDVTGIGKEVRSQFEMVLEFAYSDYDKRKINFRQGKKTSNLKRGGPRPAKKKPKATKIVQVEQEGVCPRCGHKRCRLTKYLTKRLIVDLVSTKNGIRKTITQYVGVKEWCSKCSKYHSPPGITKYDPRQLYGHRFKAWLAYQRVALRLSYESILETLEEHFNETLSVGSVPKYIKDLANYYAETKHLIRQCLLESHFIHVDETKVNVQGANWYVWVFTNKKYVVFELTETRETEIVHDFLTDYNGILISDFYPGYDSVPCTQQKCWVHLIRDLNDDLRIAPFDAEFKTFVLEIRNLFIPIMETVQKHGLKKRNLNKFNKQVDRFYKKMIIDKSYKSDLVQKYQKRFIRYQSGLFTFLKHDGIPWHNNTAEQAIRHFALQRDMSKVPFYESGIRNYLVLLGIRQTCRFQRKSFFQFLFSKEKDLDKFKALKRNRLV